MCSMNDWLVVEWKVKNLLLGQICVKFPIEKAKCCNILFFIAENDGKSLFNTATRNNEHFIKFKCSAIILDDADKCHRLKWWRRISIKWHLKFIAYKQLHKLTKSTFKGAQTLNPCHIAIDIEQQLSWLARQSLRHIARSLKKATKTNDTDKNISIRFITAATATTFTRTHRVYKHQWTVIISTSPLIVQ